MRYIMYYPPDNITVLTGRYSTFNLFIFHQGNPGAKGPVGPKGEAGRRVINNDTNSPHFKTK